MTSSDLLKNPERSLFTINYKGIYSICISKIYPLYIKEKEEKSFQFDFHKEMENCVDKYINSFKYVKEVAVKRFDSQ